MESSDKVLDKILHLSTPAARVSRFEDEEEILALLSTSHEPGEIQLLNYYRNLPICCNAELLSIEEKIAEFKVHNYQAIAINEDRFCFIKHKKFPANLVGVAKVQYVHVKKKIAFLRDFQYAEIYSERRKAVRLTIEPATGAVVTVGTVQQAGKLQDISIEAAAILFDREVEFMEGCEVTLQLQLPLQQSYLALGMIKASVYKKVPRGGKINYIFTISDNRAITNQINHYIFQRQTEIIRDLKEICP